MDQTCYRCGSQFASDVRFCPQCGSPQIRVPISVSEPEQAPTPGYEHISSAASRLQPPEYSAPTPYKWRSILPPAIILGLVAPFLLSLLKFFFVFIAISAGFMSVQLYRNHIKPRMVSLSEALRIGALTGFVSFVVSALVMLGVVALTWKNGALQPEMQKALQAAQAQNPDPQAQALLQRFMTPEGLVALMVIALVMLFFLLIMSCLIGGWLGALTRPRQSD